MLTKDDQESIFASSAFCECVKRTVRSVSVGLFASRKTRPCAVGNPAVVSCAQIPRQVTVYRLPMSHVAAGRSSRQGTSARHFGCSLVT
jgi:hypothetical protein